MEEIKEKINFQLVKNFCETLLSKIDLDYANEELTQEQKDEFFYSEKAINMVLDYINNIR